MESPEARRYTVAMMKNAVQASPSDNTGLGEAGRSTGGHQPARAMDMRIRNHLRPGDLGSLIHLHGTLYAAECGWDQTFEAYVAGPLSQFALRQGPRDCIWIVEHQGQVAGSIAIMEVKKRLAQLRWFLLHPRLRGCPGLEEPGIERLLDRVGQPRPSPLVFGLAQ